MKSVVFSVEEKFSLDGPDALQFYWQNLRDDMQTYFKRVQDGRSVMVWGVIPFCGTDNLDGGKVNVYLKYICNILRDFVVEDCELFAGKRQIFQKDNAAVHTCNYTKECFDASDTDVLHQPAKSPDLNLIENVLGRTDTL